MLNDKYMAMVGEPGGKDCVVPEASSEEFSLDPIVEPMTVAEIHHPAITILPDLHGQLGDRGQVCLCQAVSVCHPFRQARLRRDRQVVQMAKCSNARWRRARRRERFLRTLSGRNPGIASISNTPAGTFLLIFSRLGWVPSVCSLVMLSSIASPTPGIS